MRWAGLNPWDVDESEFPSTGTVRDQIAFALRYAVLAPSAHNAQPWRFRLCGTAVELWADRKRSLPVVDPADRELTMSCGAALFNLLTSLRRRPAQTVSSWV